MSQTGDHWFCRMSRQIEPSLQMLGWYIFVRNFTLGGLLGQSSENSRINLKIPPSHSVSSGPKITAFHLKREFSSGEAVIPAVQSLDYSIFLRSFSSLLSALELILFVGFCLCYLFYIINYNLKEYTYTITLHSSSKLTNRLITILII